MPTPRFVALVTQLRRACYDTVSRHLTPGRLELRPLGPEGITGGEIDLLDNHVLLTDAGPRRTIETSLQAHSIAIREKYRCSSALRRVVYV